MSSVAKARAGALHALFPVPSPPPFLCPPRFPGITLEATNMLLGVLKENHERWHIFFNEKGHHKYVIRFVGGAICSDSQMIAMGPICCLQSTSSVARRKP